MTNRCWNPLVISQMFVLLLHSHLNKAARMVTVEFKWQIHVDWLLEAKQWGLASSFWLAHSVCPLVWWWKVDERLTSALSSVERIPFTRGEWTGVHSWKWCLLESYVAGKCDWWAVVQFRELIGAWEEKQNGQPWKTDLLCLILLCYLRRVEGQLQISGWYATKGSQAWEVVSTNWQVENYKICFEHI